MIRKFIAVVAVLALAGCGHLQLTGNVAADTTANQAKVQADIQGALAAIQKVSVKDLQVAAADATAHNDPEAAMCWNGLIPIAQSLGSANTAPVVPNIVGGASLFQAIRDVLQAGPGVLASGTPLVVKQINMACGPLYVSARADVAKVVAMVGLAAAGGPGVSSAVGAIPGALAPVVNGLIQAAPKLP